MNLVKDDTFSLGTTLLAVPVGGTLALYIPQQVGRNWTDLRYVAGGGTVSIVGVGQGVTLTAAQLAAGTPGYYLSTTNALRIYGPTAFYVAGTGATSLVSQLSGFSPGTV